MSVIIVITKYTAMHGQQLSPKLLNLTHIVYIYILQMDLKENRKNKSTFSIQLHTYKVKFYQSIVNINQSNQLFALVTFRHDIGKVFIQIYRVII